MRLTEDSSVYQAIVWTAEQLVPDMPEEVLPPHGRTMIDYQFILGRKHQLLKEVLLENSYDEYQSKRKKVRRVVKSKEGLGKSQSS